MRIIRGLGLLTIGLVISVGVNAQNNKEGENLPEMVFVEGGEYERKLSPADDAETAKVKVSDFYIGKYEVTVAQFEQFVLETGYKTLTERENVAFCKREGKMQVLGDLSWRCDLSGKKLSEKAKAIYPVLYVAWEDANAYCQWAGGRLPTEAEWEWAAKGGVKSKGYKYSGGDEYNKVAWSAKTAKSAMPVGKLEPNELGIYDMSGNVWEWCHDWFNPFYFKNAPELDPLGPEEPHIIKQRLKAFRGGSWFIGITEPELRGNRTGRDAYFALGFRLVTKNKIK